MCIYITYIQKPLLCQAGIPLKNIRLCHSSVQKSLLAFYFIYSSLFTRTSCEEFPSLLAVHFLPYYFCFLPSYLPCCSHIGLFAGPLISGRLLGLQTFSLPVFTTCYVQLSGAPLIFCNLFNVTSMKPAPTILFKMIVFCFHTTSLIFLHCSLLCQMVKKLQLTMYTFVIYFSLILCKNISSLQIVLLTCCL